MYVTTIHSNPKENSKTRITSLSYIFVNRSIRENSPAIPTRERAEPRRISHEAFDWTWRRMRAKRRMRVKPNLQDAVVSTRPRRRRRRRRHHLSLRVGSRSPTCESAQLPHRRHEWPTCTPPHARHLPRSCHAWAQTTPMSHAMRTSQTTPHHAMRTS